MAESYDFKYIEFSQIHSISYLHPLILEEINSMHNPVEFINDLKTSPDISTDFPFFFYVFTGNKIIASVRTFPDVLFVGEHKYRWAWTADLLTDPNYRGQGAASYLWKRMVNIVLERDFFVGGAFANPITTHICQKMAFTVTNTAHRLLLLKSSRAFLAAHVKHRDICRLIDAIYRPSIYVLKKTILKPDSLAEWSYEIRKMDLSDYREYNRFCKVYYGDNYHFNDSKDKIAWKLKNIKHCDFYLILQKGHKNPLLYFIVKERVVHNFAGRYSNFTLMSLMDFGVYSEGEKDIKGLLLVLEQLFWAGNADVLEIVTSNTNLIRNAYRSGFLKGGRGVDFWFKL